MSPFLLSLLDLIYYFIFFRRRESKKFLLPAVDYSENFIVPILWMGGASIGWFSQSPQKPEVCFLLRASKGNLGGGGRINLLK